MTPKTLKGDENMSANKIKSKRIYIYMYHSIGTVPKLNTKCRNRGKIDTLNIHTHLIQHSLKLGGTNYHFKVVPYTTGR